MGALVCGLGLSVTSCKDDDESEKEVKVDERVVTEDGKTGIPDSLLTEQERYYIDAYFAMMNTMKSLTSVEKLTPDAFSTNHEPTYGVSLEGESTTVRSVKCESTEEAELSFREIAGLDSVSAARLLTATPDGYLLSLKDLPIMAEGKQISLGTLTFHRDGGPRRYGWVDVDIPCIPHLERIDYLSPDAFPDNAGGNSAYQLGDVVWVPGSTGFCEGYYICVKPFDGVNSGYLVHLNYMGGSKAGTGGTVTINLDGDAAGCFYPYNNSKGDSHKATAELVRAYLRFTSKNAAKVRNIRAFLEGKGYNYKPSHGDRIGDIYPGGFAVPDGNKLWIHKASSRAYIWYNATFTAEDYCIIVPLAFWDVSVPVGTIREADYIGIETSCDNADAAWWGCVKYFRDVDWNSSWAGDNYCMNVISFGSTGVGSLEYSALNDELELGIKAVNATKNDVGKCYADDGYLYESYQKAQEYSHTPLGIVVYVSDGSDWGYNVTEGDNGGGHGLVMSYSEEYCTINHSYWYHWDRGYDFNSIGSWFEDVRNNFNGYDRTQALINSGLEAAKKVDGWKPEVPFEAIGWFLPSSAQWMAAICTPGLGGMAWPNDKENYNVHVTGTSIATINKHLHDRDGQASLTSDYYWCSSCKTVYWGFWLRINNESDLYFNYNVSGDAKIRPFFAF